jgi:subtilisin family serine protease
VGLVDSGVDIATAANLFASRAFRLAADRRVVVAEPEPDRLGHGTALAGILARGVPGLRLLSAQVFLDTLSCSARQVAAALDWLVSQEARLVNMSFGLRQDRDVLRLACARAQAAGVILVAASPARGAPVFPASYPGVIRATGDARCAVDEISCLATAQADFGAHVRVDGGSVAGASVGCARLSAFAATFLARHPQASVEEVRIWLSERATYRGPERRSR